MKRIVLIALVASLTACSANEDQAQRNEASAKFEQAMASLANANAGFVADRSADPLDLTGYQVRELDNAARLLTEITGTGSPAQQAATAIALADTHAQLGRTDALAGYHAWSNHANRALVAMVTAGAVSAQQDTAAAHAGIDRNATLGGAQAQTRRANETRTAIAGEVQRIASAISKAEAAKQQTLTRRDQMVEQARQSNEQKLRATDRDKRFALQLKVEQFTRQADAADAQVDRLDLELLSLNNARAIAEAKLAYANEVAAAAEAVLAEHKQRYTKHDAAIASARDDAAQLSGKLVEGLKEMAAKYDDDIAAKYASANDHFDKAVAALRQVQSVAPADARARVQIELAGAMSEAAAVRRQKAVMDAAYLDTLSVINSYVERGFPQAAAAGVAEQLAARTGAAEQSKQAAVALLEDAVDPIGQARDAAPDKAAKIAAIQQLANVYDDLAVLTGDLAMRKLAKEQRDALAAESAE